MDIEFQSGDERVKDSEEMCESKDLHAGSVNLENTDSYPGTGIDNARENMDIQPVNIKQEPEDQEEYQNHKVTVDRQPETIFYQGSQVCQITQNNFCHTCNKWFSSIDHLNEHMSNDEATHDKDLSSPNQSKIHKDIHSDDEYRCEISDKEIKSNDNLESHKILLQTDHPHVCDVCKATFKMISHLNKHIKSVHSSESLPVKCGLELQNSPEVIKTPGTEEADRSEPDDPLLEQEKTLSGLKATGTDGHPFKCTFCNKGFTVLLNLRHHMVTHTDKYMCTLYNKDVKGQSDLETHMAINSPLKCLVCDKEFKFLSQLKTHMLTHSVERPFKCSVCDQGFLWLSNLEDHMSSHSDERPFKCSVCDKRFRVNRFIRRHMLTHSDERPFKCSVCDKGFRANRYLQRHLLTHSDNQPFQCTVCDKGFTEKLSLKRHMLTHSEERPVKCTICDRGFKEKREVKRHMLKHSDERPFKCAVCEREFKETKSLKMHMLTHSDERPFKCTVCEKEFKEKQSLNRHMSIHSDERPFKCTLCDKKYKTKHYLRRHMSNSKHRN